MIKGFRDFIMRGNVVDLAVGIVIGAAFGRLVDGFVNAFIAPLVKLLTGGRAASGTWRIRSAIFDWGGFINAVVTFLITAAAVYFFVVVPINKLNERRRARLEPEPETMSDEARLLMEIRDELARRPGSATDWSATD
jgi:large conductance mechanosensitive channel